MVAAQGHPRPQLPRGDRVHGPHRDSLRLLPVQELGCGSPSTCWRRLTEGPTPVYLTSSTWRSWRRFFAFVLVACALVCFNRL
jgi:hypothetical protein